MAQFVDSVTHIRDAIYQPGTTPQPSAAAEFAHVTAAARVHEAEFVEPVALMFARAEVRPPADGRGLGIHGPNLVQPLAVQLEKRLKRGNQDQLAAAEQAVCDALACGYVAFLSVEADTGIKLDSAATPEQMWAVMVHGFRGEGVRAAGMQDGLVTQMEGFGEDALKCALKECGLLGWRPRARVELLGRYYAHAGALLRAAQTNWDLGPKISLMANALAEDHWPYSRFALT